MSELSLGIEAKSISFLGDLSNPYHLDRAALRIATGNVLAVDNDSVWALWGDAANEKFVTDIQRIKGRDPNSRFGVTLPFEAVAAYADMDRIHPDLQKLFATPQKLTDLVGSLAFVRFPVSQHAIEGSPFGETVISHDVHQLPILQNYDPTGKLNIELLVQNAITHGATLPAATSMNNSGQGEIMTLPEAGEFIHEHMLSHVLVDSQASRAGIGSYAILEVSSGGIQLIREGNISAGLTERLLHGLPYSVSPACKKSIGDPMDRFKHYRGADVRAAVIEAREWDKLSLTN